MELKDVIQKRTSVRNFTDEPIPHENLKEIIRLAGLAPSISGSELWKFVAITNKKILGQMADVVAKKYSEIIPANDERVTENVKIAIERFSTFFTSAPVTIAVLTQPYTAVIDRIISETEFSHSNINELRNYPDIQSIGAAIENALLAAVDMGYGGCWLTGPMVAKQELAEIIGIESPYSLAAFFVIGKPAENILPKKKKPIEEIFSVIE